MGGLLFCVSRVYYKAEVRLEIPCGELHHLDVTLSCETRLFLEMGSITTEKRTAEAGAPVATRHTAPGHKAAGEDGVRNSGA